MSTTLADRAARLRALHAAPEILVLPNAWDVASAVHFAGLGAPAAATSSAAVAEALGYEDEHGIPADEMLAAVGRIAAAVDVPLTADLEAGYGLDAEALVAGMLQAGAVGCNLEDTDHERGGLRDVDDQARWLAAVKQAGRAAGVDIVVNARVDVHLRGGADLADGLDRARAYRAAGADCVYPIAVVAADSIAAYVEAAEVVNVYAMAAAPSLARLTELGVARVSFGPRLARIALLAAEQEWRDFVTPE
jgi:2-methylisocitrate lyase-like PEP mutase family enzyme